MSELFQRQASATTNAAAVTLGGTSGNPATLTYDQLNSRADHLADVLVSAGVRSGTAVLVVMGRSIDLVVTLLAILKTGG